MSPDGLDPELTLCWARALAPPEKRWVFIADAGKMKTIPLVGEPMIPLARNPLVSIDRSVYFGIDVDSSDALILIRPYERLIRNFLGQSVSLLSGRPGHAHLLTLVLDKSDLRMQLEQQVARDRKAGLPITQLTAFRLPGSQKTREHPPYRLADPMLSWDEALQILRRPLPPHHLLYTGDLTRFRESKRSGMGFSVLRDLRTRGFARDAIWALRKEPGLAKLAEKTPAWLDREIENVERALALPRAAWDDRAKIDAIREQLPGLWPGRVTDLKVLLALLQFAWLGNTLTPWASVRMLAEEAGVGWQTVSRSLKRLGRELPWQWVRLKRHATARLASTWQVLLPDHLPGALNQGDDQSRYTSFSLLGVRDGVSTLTVLALDVFRYPWRRRKSLGPGCGKFWLELPVTGRRLTSQAERRYAKRLQTVERLTGIRVITHDPVTNIWAKVDEVDWQEVARRLHVDGIGRRQRQRHAEEKAVRRYEWREPVTPERKAEQQARRLDRIYAAKLRSLRS